MTGFDPFTDAALEDPYPQYRAMREREAVQWSEKLHSWLAFCHDDAAVVLRDHERFSSDRFPGGGAFQAMGQAAAAAGVRTISVDPPTHAPLRALLNMSLVPRIKTVGPRVDALVTTLLAGVGDAVARVVDAAVLDRDTDLMEQFANPLPINVICELFDVPERDRDVIRDGSHLLARGMDRFYSRDDATRGFQSLNTYFFQAVHDRRGAGGDDLIQRLLAAEHRGDRLSEIEVVAMCGTLIFAGHETTSNLIGNGMLALLRRPAELERLRAEPALIDTAIEELLRFDSPAQMISRTARADLEIGGARIAAGQSVLAVIGSANRDPAVFDDPDRLDLVRSPNPHIAFGVGSHFCPGAALSRIEARAALPALLARYPALRLGGAPPVWRRTAILRGLEHLPVRLASSG